MVLAVFLWYESQLTAWPSLRYSRAIQASTIQSQSCRKPFFWQLFWFSFLITFEKTHWRKAKRMQHSHPSKRHPKPKLQKNLSFQIFILTIKLRIQQDTACRAIQANAFQNFSSNNFSDFHPHHPHTAKMSGVGFWPQRSPFWPFWQLLHFYPHQQASDHPYPNTQSFWSSLHCMSSKSCLTNVRGDKLIDAKEDRLGNRFSSFLLSFLNMNIVACHQNLVLPMYAVTRWWMPRR